MKRAMIVCVLVTRALGKGANDLEYRVAVVPKDDLPSNEREVGQSHKLSRLKPLFQGNKGMKTAVGYRSAAPLINEMKGHGRLKLGEVFYNCGTLYFDGKDAPLIVEDSTNSGKSNGASRSKESIDRMDRRRRNSRNAPPSVEMD